MESAPAHSGQGRRTRTAEVLVEEDSVMLRGAPVPWLEVEVPGARPVEPLRLVAPIPFEARRAIEERYGPGQLFEVYRKAQLREDGSSAWGGSERVFGWLLVDRPLRLENGSVQARAAVLLAVNGTVILVLDRKSTRKPARARTHARWFTMVPFASADDLAASIRDSASPLYLRASTRIGGWALWRLDRELAEPLLAEVRRVMEEGAAALPAVMFAVRDAEGSRA